MTYSPTTRLLTVLELLQSYKQMSGAELARRLEVNRRTVRRYIVMLQDMGIPVEGERGPDGAYHLSRGYKLPPLMFTDAEAVAMTMGLLTMRKFQFPVDVAAVEGALAKTERVMPDKLLQQARGLQESIVFNTSLPPALFQSTFVTTLSLAAQQRLRVFMRYQSFGGEVSERDYDPYGIVYNDGFWYTAGYCHLRQDLRTFRLDRVVALEPREATFERPADFDLLEHVLKSIALWPGVNQVEVFLETTMERAQQVLPSIMGTLEEVENGVIFRRVAHEIDWVAHVLMSVDFPVRILKGDGLRERIRELGQRAQRIIDES
jgi:predicted DNA-binding transcriptional regulator YafY